MPPAALLVISPGEYAVQWRGAEFANYLDRDALERREFAYANQLRRERLIDYSIRRRYSARSAVADMTAYGDTKQEAVAILYDALALYFNRMLEQEGGQALTAYLEWHGVAYWFSDTD